MKKSWLLPTIIFGFILLYFSTHLPFLTFLPVFADESIYIRWAQLILDDWRQYFFFPLNDGKTPLFVWLLVPALKIFADPLLAGRLVSVVAGLIQVWATVIIVKKLGGKPVAMWAASLAASFLPFWYFHQRMALMDGPLATLLSISLLCLLYTNSSQKKAWRWAIGSGVFLGLALLTKLPALLFMPALVLAPWLLKTKKQSFKLLVSWSSAAILVGLMIFFSLKLHPAFGQLFNRGNDFLYSPADLLAANLWSVMWKNSWKVFTTLATYLTWPIMLLPFAGLFQDKWRRKHTLLILATLGFLGPIILMGKTIYPRYLLPAAIPITISAVLAFEQFFLKTQQLIKKPWSFFTRSAVLIFGLTLTISTILEFLLISWKNPDYLPYTPLDREQYVQEWSSGHGIKATTDLLLAESQARTTAVATEGYFGTLPDGILMYLHNQDVSKLVVEGIGQPIRQIPAAFRDKAQQYEQVWLVVNSHRQLMSLQTNPAAYLKQQYCRPVGSPCLEIWDITNLIHKTP